MPPGRPYAHHLFEQSVRLFKILQQKSIEMMVGPNRSVSEQTHSRGKLVESPTLDQLWRTFGQHSIEKGRPYSHCLPSRSKVPFSQGRIQV